MRTKTKDTLKQESILYVEVVSSHYEFKLLVNITNDEEIVNYGEKEIPSKILRTADNSHV